MSETTLLCVGSAYAPLPGCTEEESLVCHRLVRTLVRSGAGVFAGVKPASLFSFDVCACERCCGTCLGQGAATNVIEDALRALGCTLQRYGYGLAVIGLSASRVMLLLYRVSGVERLLSEVPKHAFLVRRGYDTSGPAELVGCFVERLERYYATHPKGHATELSEFPHEIGLLFGYPLDDVEGFMSKATPTCRGPWMAYGNAEEAQRNFEALQRAEAGCRKRFAQGISFGEFAQASAA